MSAFDYAHAKSYLDARAGNFPEPKYFCDVLIPAGGIIILAGAASAGKSVTAINLMASLVDGRDFFGFKVPAPLRAYYLNMEQGEARFLDRIHCMDQAVPVVHPDAGRFVSNLGFDFSSGSEVAALRRDLEAFRPDVLILDTMVKLTASEFDENKSGHMAAFFRRLETLRISRDMSFILLHHANKSHGDGEHEVNSLDRLRGSTAIAAAADNCFYLEDHHGRKKLRSAKLRDHAPIADIDYLITGDYTLVPSTGERVASEHLDKVLGVLIATPEPMTYAELEASTKIPKSTLYRALNELQARAFVRNEGRKWVVSEAGRTFSHSGKSVGKTLKIVANPLA